MFPSMTLGRKIGLGFTVLLAIAIVLGVTSIWSMRSVEDESHMLAAEYAPEVEIANNVERHVLEASLAVRSYGFTFDKKYLAASREHLAALKKHIGECRELAQRSPHLVKLKESVGGLSTKSDEFEHLINETENTEKEIERCRARLNTDAKIFMEACNAYLHSQEEHMKKDIKEDVADERKLERLHKIDLITHIIEYGDACRLLVWKSQALRDPKLYAESEPLFVLIDKGFDDARRITRIDVDRKAIEQASNAAHDYKKSMTELRSAFLAMQETGRKRAAAGEALAIASRDISLAGIKHTREIADHASEALSTATKVNIVGLIVATLVSVCVALMVTRGITSALNVIIAGLRGSSEQVNSASSQVAESSQQMAAGASQQASSLEETSASLEEMASMTKQNTENAQQANVLAADAKSSAERGRDAMQRMSDAIQQIKVSSDQTAKIVKTIDEIAFQTNLLALNAAVEAARAGDAGKGFAVVAEEVRNLAMRSAEAAKNTASLIEQSQKSSDHGVHVSAEVTEILKKIVDGVQKLAQINGEVSTACEEQSRGIDQVNTAVSEVDKVTQSNAANAEESASAAEELSAQARELSDMVASLVKMVGGSVAVPIASQVGAVGRSVVPPARESSRQLPAAKTKMEHFASSKPSLGKVQSAKSERATKSKAKAESVIPLNDDEMAEF